MILSMTGFAAARGAGAGASWDWDIRSVNGKGLDLRLRLPEGIEGLEPAIRAGLGRAISRGNVSLNLRLVRDTGAADAPRVNQAVLAVMLAGLARVEAAAQDIGVALRPASAADILTLRGVLEQAAPELGAEAGDAPDTAPLREALLADLAPLIAAFHAMRAAEGAALQAIITAQLDRIEALVADARACLGPRAEAQARALATQITRIAPQTSVDPARFAQELALIAVKSDVAEELDRLGAHITAARTLLAEGAQGPVPVGRKLDFLTQEFMREANTLCSKSSDPGLTRTGLDLKTVIDQMREQIQNVE